MIGVIDSASLPGGAVAAPVRPAAPRSFGRRVVFCLRQAANFAYDLLTKPPL